MIEVLTKVWWVVRGVPRLTGAVKDAAEPTHNSKVCRLVMFTMFDPVSTKV